MMVSEYVGMAISFVGVIFIALYDKKEITEDSTNMIFMGVMLSFVMAWAESFINLFNRMMNDVDWYVITFWHSAIGLVSPLIFISIEALIKGEFRLFTAYTSRQWTLLMTAALIDFVILSASIIATQATSLSFISLIGYLIVFYAFLADIFIFHESFSLMQAQGAASILGATVAVSVLKFCQERKRNDESF